MAYDLPEVAELDLNPVIARGDSCQAADARIKIAPTAPDNPFLPKLR
jgi:ATP-grasp domain